MNRIEDITRKRSILLTTRMRFSPQSQPVRESAIEKVIEQILFTADIGESLSLQEIQNVFSSETTDYAIGSREMEDSLQRLVRKQKVVLEQKGKRELYRLSGKTRQELDQIQREAEVRFNSVVTRLFKNAKEGSSVYNDPFLEFLCIIFSKFGEECVRVIKGNIKEDEYLSFPFIFSALKEVEKDFNSIDHSLFRRAVISFLQDSDPDYTAIKWNMAQSYYIVKVLGLDHSGILLSEEVFGHAVFYLDTNIIISALEPTHKCHEGFLAFNKACKQLGISLRVCQTSLNELQNFLVYQRDLMEQVPEQIPDETASKVHSIFYEIYREKKMSGETADIDELFASFGSPMDDLRNLFAVKLEDDIWFDEAQNKVKTTEFAESLRSKYKTMRGRAKGWPAALHDAILLLWLQKVREEISGNVWLVTLDTSLPGSVPPSTSAASLAITLDALLQWISPIAAPENEENGFTTMFAEMIKHRLLPQEKIFDLEDFLIFHEMHMSCKELPAEDVEECIRYIKVNAPTLDPSDPTDREKLAYEVSKFFADPGRKYKQEVARLETENIKIKQEYEKKLGNVTNYIEGLKLQHEKDLKERDRKIEELKGKFSKYEERTQEESLKRSAGFRISLTVIVFIILESLVVFLASQYGVGQNLFQKVLNSWQFLGLGFVLTTVIGWFIVGEKRLKVLGWPFTKIFKHE